MHRIVQDGFLRVLVLFPEYPRCEHAQHHGRQTGVIERLMNHWIVDVQDHGAQERQGII
ncbi:hypothetical protein [Acidithiobacillus sp.]|uniref:hypothetical protein n=1 Tax=Acidithiobacillus sp. TaxID=1872118 RepID=UPI00258A7974|nr:hypothetical protein [Acidithiobacillus sp.]MDD5375115.1 hypothetical protein [Acidithiobacillus sp.]